MTTPPMDPTFAADPGDPDRPDPRNAPAPRRKPPPSPQPTGVLATWIEAALEAQAMPQVAELTGLLDRWPVARPIDMGRAVQALRSLQECVEAMPTAVGKLRWTDRLARRTDLAARRLAPVLAQAAAGARVVHEQAEALAAENARQTSPMRLLAAALSLDVNSLERVVRHCEGLLVDMRTGLLVRRPAPNDAASAALLLKLANRADRYRRCLKGLRKVVDDARGLAILLNVWTARRQAAATMLGTSLPGLYRQWERQAQALVEATGDRSLPAPDAAEMEQLAERLLARLREAAATCTQASIDEAALEMARAALRDLTTEPVEITSGATPLPDPSVRAPLEVAPRPRRPDPAPDADEPASESAWQRFEAQQQGDDEDGILPLDADAADATDAAPGGPTLADVMALVRAGRQVCLQPGPWAGLHALLPPLELGGRLRNAPPPLDADDPRIPASQKRLRLLEQVAWADRAGCLAAVQDYLAALAPADWVVAEPG